jgi:hypothetical protein
MAIRVDKPLVLSGFEAKLGWFAHRVLPLRAHQRIARQGI